MRAPGACRRGGHRLCAALDVPAAAAQRVDGPYRLDGVVLHYFMHAEPTGGSATTNPAALNHRRRVAGKRMAFEIKNTLEASRPVGTPPRHS